MTTTIFSSRPIEVQGNAPMDATLTQILAALYQAHQTIDQLRLRVAELESESNATKSAGTSGGGADATR